VLGVATANDLYRSVGNIMCAQILTCLKSMYPSILSRRWVPRPAGTDVSTFTTVSIQSLHMHAPYV
jgi:hypothetical protein